MKKYNMCFLFIILLSLVLSACGNGAEDITISTINENDENKYHLTEWDVNTLGLEKPSGICIYNDFIYVTDTGKHYVVQLDKDLKVVATYGTMGMEEGNFTKPMDITYSAGSFYVLDNGNRRIQRFTQEFEFIEEYPLDSLTTEQGSGRYISIIADSEGGIYLSTYAPGEYDAYIFKWDSEGRKWDRFGENVIGYLCSNNEKIYFANVMEFIIEERKTTIMSGINYLYEIKDNKMYTVGELYKGLLPVALTLDHDDLYMIGDAYATVFYFEKEKMNLAAIVKLPQSSPFMHMAIGEDGTIYITDNDNGRFYQITKSDS